MRFDILTLFPEMVFPYCQGSILGKAQEKSLIKIVATNIRNFAIDKHHLTDDSPYGGGPGMVMKIEPLVAAIESAKKENPEAKVLLMSPRGKTFTQKEAQRFRSVSGLILVCGRYEGVDERVLNFVDEEVSLGDFVLTGGEVAALAIVDAVARLVPGVLGNVGSNQQESFEGSALEFPQYTRPPEFRELTVPEVLQSGDHARIARWRRWQSLQLTKKHRPDLFAKISLSPADVKLLSKTEDGL